jgi:hypothetical protein
MTDFHLAMNRWIPVEERLPEKYQEVIVLRSDDGCEKAKFSEVFYSMQNFAFIIKTVTHWMPLPEKPEGVKD